MKAIILTYDKYRALAEHMIFKYDQAWPGHPFCFRIPYQHIATPASQRREYIKTPPEIKATVLGLLNDLPDDEWIYWCIDDKFPIELNLPKIRILAEYLETENPTDMSCVLFCRCRDVLRAKNLTGHRLMDSHGNVYLERMFYNQIWIHQFLRVKVIRHLFLSFPDNIPSARIMDQYKSQLDKPASHRLYVTKENLAVFGESTTSGKLTPICYRSFIQNSLALPDWFSTTEEDPCGDIMGRLGYKERNSRLRQSLASAVSDRFAAAFLGR